MENSADTNLIAIISEFQVDLYSVSISICLGEILLIYLRKFQIILPYVHNTTNVAISAISVQTGLAILYCGANGATKAEMQASLIFNNLTTIPMVTENFRYFLQGITTTYPFGGATIEMVNGLYIRDGYTIRKSFQALAQQSFFSHITNINFTQNVVAATKINNYVSNHTNGQITNLVDPSTITQDTVMILVNSIYFKAFWKHGFSAANTVNGSIFHTSSTTSTNVDMMYQEVLEQLAKLFQKDFL